VTDSGAPARPRVGVVVAVRGTIAALSGLVAALAGHDVAVGEVELATHAGANTPSPAAASARHSPDDHEKLPTVRSIMPTITSVEPCFTAIVPRDDPATTLAA
jgi:hypothetical protein